MPRRVVRVVYTEQGRAYDVEVSAESVFEAVIVALDAYQRRRYLRGPHKRSIFEVCVPRQGVYRVRLERALRWLYEEPARTAHEAAQKARLKAALA